MFYRYTARGEAGNRRYRGGRSSSLHRCKQADDDDDDDDNDESAFLVITFAFSNFDLR